jgi:hypothetical protein
MDDGADLQPWTRAMLADSVLGPYVANYRKRLIEQRYAANTQRVYLCCVSHFASWLRVRPESFSAIAELPDH